MNRWIFLLLMILSKLSFGQSNLEPLGLVKMIIEMEKQGASTDEIGWRAADYWSENFKNVASGLINEPANQSGLLNLVEKYEQRTQFRPPPSSELLQNIENEIENNGAISGVGQVNEDLGKSIQALKGAFGISIAATNGRTLSRLLQLLSKNQKELSASDLLIYRIFSEQSSGMGDNLYNLKDDQKRYTPADFVQLAELSNHANPVARLIAVEMLQYIPNANEDEMSELAEMMRGLVNEDNPAVIKRVIERGTRQRSKVYDQVLPELAKRLATTNPILKEEGKPVTEEIEQTPEPDKPAETKPSVSLPIGKPPASTRWPYLLGAIVALGILFIAIKASK
jgi:hypothetical protein